MQEFGSGDAIPSSAVFRMTSRKKTNGEEDRKRKRRKEKKTKEKEDGEGDNVERGDDAGRWD